jgi:hypothetical protein
MVTGMLYSYNYYWSPVSILRVRTIRIAPTCLRVTVQLQYIHKKGNPWFLPKVV